MRLFLVCTSVLIFGLSLPPVRAQMILPGALRAAPSAPAAGGKSAIKPAGGAEKHKPVVVAVKSASEEALLGHELTLNGKSGKIGFARDGGALAVSFLTIL